MNYHEYLYKKHILHEYTNYCLLRPIFDMNISRVNNLEILELGSPDVFFTHRATLTCKGPIQDQHYMTSSQFPQKNY